MKAVYRNTVAKALVIAVALSSGTTSITLASEWTEKIKVKGDLRYRHEMIKKDDNDARHRQRVRARIGIFGEVSPYTNVGVQLATGSDDPVSTNQTLDGAFSTKQVGIDLAYFEASHKVAPGFTLLGGKFKNPFFKPGKSELVWDSDWNPEGGVLRLNKGMDNFDLALTGAGLWIDERSSSDDSFIAAAQAVGRLHFNEKKSSLALGGSFFNYVNTRGFQPFFDPDDPMGNSVVTGVLGDDTVDVYANDFELFEVFGEITHQFEKMPVTVMADFVSNSAADSLGSGWLVGLRIGKAKKPGSWQFRYNYRNVEKDAVVGMFTDSDFRGGGTDAKGHELGGGVQLAQNTTFSVSYFMNKIGLEADETTDFKRLQIDLQLKF